MIHGTFLERATDPHVRLRANLLKGTGPLQVPTVLPHPGSPTPAEIVGPGAIRVLDADGLLVVQLEHPLSNAEFAAMGRRLGTLVPETDPVVLPQVDDGVVLNLTTSHEATEDTSIQPFATSALTLHSEGSGRPAAEQPRYVVLMCCDPGEDAAAMATVLVSMDEVASRLAPETRERLTHVRYRNGTPPPILREWEGRPVFSFRDFRADTLEWTSSIPGDDPDAVNGSLRELLSAMYNAEGAQGIVWSPGLLVIIDNRRHFHGRRAATRVGAGRRRRLKRLRIRQA